MLQRKRSRIIRSSIPYMSRRRISNSGESREKKIDDVLDEKLLDISMTGKRGKLKFNLSLLDSIRKGKKDLYLELTRA